MKEHIINEPKTIYTCEYCGFENTCKQLIENCEFRHKITDCEHSYNWYTVDHHCLNKKCRDCDYINSIEFPCTEEGLEYLWDFLVDWNKKNPQD